jgi:hypothetical protein
VYDGMFRNENEQKKNEHKKQTFNYNTKHNLIHKELYDINGSNKSVLIPKRKKVIRKVVFNAGNKEMMIIRKRLGVVIVKRVWNEKKANHEMIGVNMNHIKIRSGVI